MSVAGPAVLVESDRSYRPRHVREPAIPQRGDWFQTTTVQLRFYDFPPSATVEHVFSGMARCAERPLINRLRAGTYIGPVHEVEVSSKFLSVRVPHPEGMSILVWVNIWKPTIQLVCPVQRNILKMWRSAGWCDWYIDR